MAQLPDDENSLTMYDAALTVQECEKP